jgi:hypothetical protein
VVGCARGADPGAGGGFAFVVQAVAKGRGRGVSRRALHFLNAPHINKRPLKTRNDGKSKRSAVMRVRMAGEGSGSDLGAGGSGAQWGRRR